MTDPISAAIAKGDVTVRGDRVTLHLATAQVVALMVSLSILATVTIGAVWLATRDLTREVENLSSAVNELRSVITSQDSRIHELETDTEVVTEIQRRVLQALGYLDNPAVGKALRDTK